MGTLSLDHLPHGDYADIADFGTHRAKKPTSQVSQSVGLLGGMRFASRPYPPTNLPSARLATQHECHLRFFGHWLKKLLVVAILIDLHRKMLNAELAAY